MMDILENELVKKYFECTHFDKYHKITNHDFCMSYKVLRAMQEPKKSWDKCLRWDKNGVTEETVYCEHEGGQPSLLLRLPNRFQKPGCQHEKIECVNCAKPFPKPPAPEKCPHGFKDSETCPIETPYPKPASLSEKVGIDENPGCTHCMGINEPPDKRCQCQCHSEKCNHCGPEFSSFHKSCCLCGALKWNCVMHPNGIVCSHCKDKPSPLSEAEIKEALQLYKKIEELFRRAHGRAG